MLIVKNVKVETSKGSKDPADASIEAKFAHSGMITILF